VIVVQHGQKVRAPGDPGLTPLGREQAADVAERVAGERVVAVWSSPLRRAVETAEVVGRRVGLAVRADGRLRERMNWDGPGGIELDDFLREWRRATDDRAYAPRVGDSSQAAAQRFLGALGDIADAGPHGTLVVVAHGGVTVDALRTLLGDDEVRRRAPGVMGDGVPGGALTTFVRDGHGERRWGVEGIAVAGHRPA
jgi:broad specificity phosphatase PhoE